MCVTTAAHCITAPLTDFRMIREAQKQAYIEEHELSTVYLSCYLPTGNRTADGTVPYEGICSVNREHLGQKCVIYDRDTLEVIAELECRDIGGNRLLREGKAVDVFKNTMDDALKLKRKHGNYVYIEWIDATDREPAAKIVREAELAGMADR